MNENNAIDTPPTHGSVAPEEWTIAAFRQRNNLSPRTDKNMGKNR